MTYRSLSADDVERLHVLDHLVGGTPWSRASIEQAVTDRLATCWGIGRPLHAYLLGRAVGVEAELHRIAVDPTARRRGEGRTLLAHALNEWASLGVREVHLEVRSDNLPALGLYRSFQFETTGTRPGYYNGVDALTMRCTCG